MTAELVSLDKVREAQLRLNEVVNRTPLMLNLNLSEKYGCRVLLKREDLQTVRSYKIRGAYNKIASLDEASRAKGVICASAGNHAQGVAYACHRLGIKGVIYMPAPTPRQKVNQVRMFGQNAVEVVLQGDTFDDSFREALARCEQDGMTFIHPFDDNKVIEGQATVGMEILEDQRETIDFLFVPVGGGGLAAGVGSVFRQLSPKTKIIGVEPEGAPAMKISLEKGELVTLDTIERFVDGAAVKRVGEKTFALCKEVLDGMATVHEGKVCSTIMKLYNEDAIVVEPAGALSIAVLDQYAKEIKGKTVVCVVSGSNNDITRTEEIKERSLLYENLKHYFIIRFPQRAGALREFLNDVLGPKDDITHFEYSKKNSRERGPAVIGIELQDPADFDGLIQRLKDKQFVFEYLNNRPDLFQFLV
ncbi:MAG: threonine ammonia-lyase [Flavobacteriales bacterium]|nr:threonine ammonia-lyase [Flavobacteriales bacterium]MCB9448067.1 threonine ammonia-lyase [Flavobacteriales bacterium]